MRPRPPSEAIVTDSIYGKPLADWLSAFPLLRPLMEMTPVEWFNPAVAPLVQVLADIRSMR